MKTGIYIDSEGNETEVEFDDLQHELLERIDCYDAVYKAIGHDSVGNRYSAYATFSCGECIELEEIEPEPPAGLKALFDRYKANLEFEKEFHPEVAGKSETDKQEFYRQLKR